MKKTTIFFDMDNTLIDRMQAAQKTYRYILENSTIPFEEYDEVFNLMWSMDNNGEFPKADIFKEVALRYNYDQNWINKMVDLWFDALPEFTIVFEKTVSTLNVLKSKYKIGMITNGSFKMQSRKIEVAGFAELFDCIVIAGKYQMSKPQKELFLMACEQIGCQPQEAYFVGDSIKNDIQGSKDVGMTPIYIWRDDTKPCTIKDVPQIYTIEQLLEVI